MREVARTSALSYPAGEEAGILIHHFSFVTEGCSQGTSSRKDMSQQQTSGSHRTLDVYRNGERQWQLVPSGPIFPAWNADVLSGVPAATLDHKANEDGSHMLKMEMQTNPEDTWVLANSTTYFQTRGGDAR